MCGPKSLPLSGPTKRPVARHDFLACSHKAGLRANCAQVRAAPEHVGIWADAVSAPNADNATANTKQIVKSVFMSPPVKKRAHHKSARRGNNGTEDEFGAACAFLCSAQAGYITGQNLPIDGGMVPTAF